MLILSIEASAKAASCALCRDGELIAQYFQAVELTHSKTLLPMVESMLSNSGVTLESVDAIACSHGPGSFTGIRIGVAAVKGLAWAADKRCIGVSTLEAMAYNGVSAGGYVCCVMDARRSQVYNALFEIKNGVPVRLCPDRAVSLEELIEDIKMLSGPVFLTGDGTNVAAKAFDAAGILYRRAPAMLLYQNAAGVAMAAEGKDPVSADELLPVYLRLSQAERERQARMQQQ